MATKTFKIGEYAKGDITVEIKNKKIAIILKSYNSQTVLDRTAVQEDYSDAQWTLKNKLFDWTSSYYADKVFDWIKEKSKIQASFFR